MSPAGRHGSRPARALLLAPLQALRELVGQLAHVVELEVLGEDERQRVDVGLRVASKALQLTLLDAHPRGLRQANRVARVRVN